MTDPVAEDIEKKAEELDEFQTGWAELFALMWAWFLAFVRKPPRAPRDGHFSRIRYKRRGFTTWVFDLETREELCIRAESVPEARQFCSALAFGAKRKPNMSARDVTRAAMKLVASARESNGLS